ncbi:MAG: guanylate kinase [Clostridiales bacterium]|nr:guanylate kinase [Clostridiales bacterium]
MDTKGIFTDTTDTKGLLIVISGPSGAGKGTICQELLKLDPGLALSISATTRKQSPQEVYGREYYFYTEYAFQKTIEEDGFLEWAEVHGRRYGTLKDKVREIWESGKDCLLEIDVQGGLQIAQKMDANCILLFVKAPSEEELLKRITGRRREDREEIKRRMMTAQWEMTQEEKYHYTIVNDHLADAVEHILEIIREERKANASTIHR